MISKIACLVALFGLVLYAQAQEQDWHLFFFDACEGTNCNDACIADAEYFNGNYTELPCGNFFYTKPCNETEVKPKSHSQ